MKTEYNVIWIDDSIEAVRGDIRTIRNYLNAEEITLNLKSFKTKAGERITEVDDFLNSVKSYDLDFILLDFNMPEMNGVEVIEYLRTDLGDYHTPIVFYSNDNTANLSDVINEKNKRPGTDNYIDGIFFCHRDNISAKVTSLIASQLKRDYKVNAVRGTLIEKVSGIDVDINIAIEQLYSLVDVEKRPIILKYIKEKFDKKGRESAKFITDLQGLDYEQAIQFVMANHRATDSLFRAELTRYMLKYIPDAEEYGEVVSDFYNRKGDKLSLNCFRNYYAHRTETELLSLHNSDSHLFIKREARRQRENLDIILTLRGPAKT